MLTAVLAGMIVWGVTSSETEMAKQSDDLAGTENYIQTQSQAETKRARESNQQNVKNAIDNALLEESLSEGFVPTQEIGETGSLNGALVTKDYPMHYKPSKYERLENSPLLVFTDDMIWKNDENSYVVKRDAMADQAYHYQEASIALSISPRIEKGQVSGYRFVEIPQGTLFSKLGMTSGDVLLTINGMKPDMEPMALMFVNMVAGKQGRTSIVVEHRGVKRTINIRAAE